MTDCGVKLATWSPRAPFIEMMDQMNFKTPWHQLGLTDTLECLSRITWFGWCLEHMSQLSWEKIWLRKKNLILAVQKRLCIAPGQGSIYTHIPISVTPMILDRYVWVPEKTTVLVGAQSTRRNYSRFKWHTKLGGARSFLCLAPDQGFLYKHIPVVKIYAFD